MGSEPKEDSETDNIDESEESRALDNKIARRLTIFHLMKVILVAPLLCFCLAAFWFLFVQEPLVELQIKQSLKIYPGAISLFADSDGVTRHTVQMYVFYSSTDPIESVKTFYSKQYSNFLPGDTAEDWLIFWNEAGSDPKTVKSENVSNTVTHYEVCDDITHTCVSVSLVKADHKDLCTLGILPGNRAYKTQYTRIGYPYPKCNQFPKNGTLIIYSYRLPG